MTNAIATMRQPNLRVAGALRQVRVLLVYPPSLDFIVAYLACLRAGVVAVPVFPPHPGGCGKTFSMQVFIKVQEQGCLTNKMYNFAKKVAGIKEMFSKEKKKWPDVEWILTTA